MVRSVHRALIKDSHPPTPGDRVSEQPWGCAYLIDPTPTLKFGASNSVVAFPARRGGRRFNAGTMLLYPHIPRQYICLRSSFTAPRNTGSQNCARRYAINGSKIDLADSLIARVRAENSRPIWTILHGPAHLGEICLPGFVRFAVLRFEMKYVGRCRGDVPPCLGG